MGCIGMGQAPAIGRNSLRTVPRNFPGRSGTDEDSVWLCSPETAAAAALTGQITDPRDLPSRLGIDYPALALPPRVRRRRRDAPGGAAGRGRRAPGGAGQGAEHRHAAGLRRASRRPAGAGGDQGGRQHLDRRDPARGRPGAAVPQRHRPAGRVHLQPGRPGLRGAGPRGRDARHRRGRELRPGLLPRARGHRPPLPRAAAGDREVLRPDPLAEPGQLRRAGRSSSPTRPTTTASRRATSYPSTG